MLRELKKLVIGAVLTLSGAIMMTSEETVAVAGMVVGIVGLLFLVVSLLSGSSLASYYKEEDSTMQEPDNDVK